MQVQITGHVYAQQYSWESEPTYIVSSYGGMGDEHRAYISEVKIAYEVPDDYNHTAALHASKLAALAKKREAACKEFAATVRAIDEQISKLTAIGCDEVAA